ncbi:unnamed protein product [Sphenostylis stenocarpa]|uniref:Uncharacterized protein n=1 Tax=Sphenostylis stenocarpa TaxID=92480 RepID=A0AA86RRL1_9FABA|nr:unnamed protein product [Sphenostylis stenocarpa]
MIKELKGRVSQHQNKRVPNKKTTVITKTKGKKKNNPSKIERRDIAEKWKKDEGSTMKLGKMPPDQKNQMGSKMQRM